MKWRVVLELTGPDGTVGIHEVSGGATVAEYAPRMIGLTLWEIWPAAFAGASPNFPCPSPRTSHHSTDDVPTDDLLARLREDIGF